MGVCVALKKIYMHFERNNFVKKSGNTLVKMYLIKNTFEKGFNKQKAKEQRHDAADSAKAYGGESAPAKIR